MYTHMCRKFSSQGVRILNSTHCSVQISLHRGWEKSHFDTCVCTKFSRGEEKIVTMVVLIHLYFCHRGVRKKIVTGGHRGDAHGCYNVTRICVTHFSSPPGERFFISTQRWYKFLLTRGWRVFYLYTGVCTDFSSRGVTVLFFLTVGRVRNIVH